MGVSVLGPLEIDGLAREPGRRDRVVLAALVVASGDSLSKEVLADALWGETRPASWAKVLQGCVVRLRKLLGGAAIESGDFGYRLALTELELDSARFERGLQRAREALAGDDPDRAAYLAGEALDLWRGRALPDLDEWEPGRVRAGQLDGLRMDAEELFVEAHLAAGRAASVLEEARGLVARAPFRERRWVLLATALHHSGRQAEAMAALQRARAMLADELGMDPSRELADLEVLLLRQDPSLTPRLGREISRVCPYQGLLAYDAMDGDLFFGRDDEVAAALRRLRETGVLAVVGPSGVGKSSLVRAGVVATLLRGGDRVLVTTPGARPRDSLVGLAPGGRQTLVVDQAEEAITMCSDPVERAAYFAAVAGHVDAGGPLVLSLRADHLGDLAPYPRIRRVIEDGMLLLGPMGEPGLRRAIEEPALRVGLRLEPGLVDLLVREVQGEPAALPLLSHVLQETWQRREGPTLTVSGYRATGGVRHAVAQSAETLYEAMDDAQRARLRSLLLRLVQRTEGGDPVRARVSRAKVAGDVQSVELVERLVAARLVTVDGDSVEVAHEALFREWPRLGGWLDDDVDGQRLFRHLSGAADAWAALGRPDSELYRGARLDRALDWRDHVAPDLDETEQAFLDASLALNQSEERAAAAQAAYQRVVNRRLRGALSAVGALLAVALVAGSLAVGSADRARRNQRAAEASAALVVGGQQGSRALAIEAPATSLLLAVAALRVGSSPQAWDTLGAALMRNPSLLAVRQTNISAPVPGGLSWLPDDDSLAVSADGAFVAASDPVSGVKLFDATTLQPRELEGDRPHGVVSFSPDSSLLAAAHDGRDTEIAQVESEPVVLYDMPERRRAARQLGGWPADARVQEALVFSGDGQRIAAGINFLNHGDWSPTGVISVWDLAHRDEPLFTVQVPQVEQVALSPDGRSVYAVVRGTQTFSTLIQGLVGTVLEYDVDSGQLVRWVSPALLSGRVARGVDVSPDGSTLAVATPSHILRLATPTLEMPGPALTGHSDEITDLHFSHDGTSLLSVSMDGGVIVWNATTGAERGRLAPGTGSSAAGFSGDDSTVYTGTEDLMKWDLSGTREFYALGASTASEHEQLRLAHAAPDGRTVARHGLGGLSFVDDRTGTTTSSVALLDDQDLHNFSRDGRWFLANSDREEVLRVWNTHTGRLVAERPKSREGWQAAFDTTGNRIYLAEDFHGFLLTLDRTTLEEVAKPVLVGYDVAAVLPDHATGTVLVIYKNGTASRFDPSIRGAQHPAAVGPLTIAGVVPALSPDGTRLMGLDADRRARIMDLDTGAWLAPAMRVDWASEVTFVYSPDGTQVASAGPDRIRLWDGRTGEYQASMPLPKRMHDVSIAYLPDSSGLLVTTLEGSSWTVPTRTSTWVERACAIAGRNMTQAEWDQFFPGRPYQATCPQ